MCRRSGSRRSAPRRLAAARYAKGQLGAATAAVTEAAEQRRATDRHHSEQLQHETKVREEESDPYVVVFGRRLVLKGALYFELVVKNFGVTAAHSVTFEWDPHPRTAMGNTDEVTFPEKIAFLAPGQEYSTLWDSLDRRVNSPLLPEKIHRVLVEYQRRPGGRTISHDITIDLDDFNGAWVELNTIHELTKEVSRLRQETIREVSRLRQQIGQ